MQMGTKPKLVVMLSRFPYPLEKGDKLRAYYQIKELSADYEIFLIAVSEKKIGIAELKQLEEYCSAIHIVRISKLSILINLFVCLFSNKPFQVGYFYSLKGHLKVKRLLKETQPKHIYCQLIRATEYVKDYHACPKTLDYMDALSKGIERRISKASWYSKWLFISETKRLKLYERSVFDYFENKIIISDQDRELILHPQKQQIMIIPNGIDQRFFESLSTKKEYDLVFIGNLSYAPNIEAVEFISNEILNERKDLNCLISGATPHPTVQRICKSNNNITLQGWIEDIREAYCKGRIFIAPMMIGTGMQNKLLEAMALGIPCITTSLANNAIKAIHGESIIVANTKNEFIEAIDLLLKNDELYQKIAQEGRLFVQKNYSWKIATSPLKELMDSNVRI
jgi:glycosyltransferase involved in cell wall biosynthesis